MGGISDSHATKQQRDPIVRAAGIVLAIGAAGVVVTCVGYGLSPPEAAMPIGPIDAQSAMAAAVSGRATMRLAGLAGIPGDVLTTAAWMALAVTELFRQRGLAAIGWFLLACSTILFVAVDTTVGFVLPPLATAGAEQAFLGSKTSFDGLFLASTFTFGIGTVLALLRHATSDRTIVWPLAVLGLLAGFACTVAAAGGLTGTLVSPYLLGGGIAVGALAYCMIGLNLSLRAEL